mgnify:FL=1
MDWNFNNDMPIYTQLVDKIKLSIVSGQLAPGDKLNTVRELAAEAKVNPNTMQRAFQELERGGLVFSQRNSGRFVTEDVEAIMTAKKALAQQYIQSFIKNMEQLGYTDEEILGLLREEKEEEKQ